MSSTRIQHQRKPSAPPGQKTKPDALQALWQFFTSMKTAIGLLILLAAVSIAGTRMDDGVGNSIYGSWWYSTLLLVAGLNLAFCTISRLRAGRLMVRPTIAATPREVARLPRNETLESAGTPDTVAEKVVRALQSRGYHVLTQSSGQLVSIYARRGLVSIWGEHLTNLSLIVLFAGLILGQPTGPDGTLTLMEGKRASDYHREKPAHQHFDLPFEIGLKSFTFPNDKARSANAYSSNLQFFEDGREVAQETVTATRPQTYKGVSFQQADHGLVGLVVKVSAPDGKSAFLAWDIKSDETPDGRVYTLADQPLHQFDLSGKKLTLYIHSLVPDYVGGPKVNGSMLPRNPAVQVMFNDHYTGGQAINGWTPLGWMTVGKPAAYKGYTIVLERVVRYTVLRVSRHADLTVVYAGLAMLAAGLILWLSGRHRAMRACVSQGRSGPGGAKVSSVVAGADSPGETGAFDGDFQRLRDALM